MGSPMDTARNPKQPNELAPQRPLAWFENNVVVRVPWPNPGFMRRVYPGFLQLSGFLAMNIDRHVDAHVHQFQQPGARRRRRRRAAPGASTTSTWR